MNYVASSTRRKIISFVVLTVESVSFSLEMQTHLPNVRSKLQVSAQRPAKRPVQLLLGPSVQNIFYSQKGRQQHKTTKCRKLHATQIYNAQENRELFILLLVTSLLEEGTQACLSYLWWSLRVTFLVLLS